MKDHVKSDFEQFIKGMHEGCDISIKTLTRVNVFIELVLHLIESKHTTLENVILKK